MKLDELESRLKSAEFRAMLPQIMQRIVLTVEAQAKRNSPVVTGNLRRSITSRVEGAGERGVVGTNVVYAQAVHDGVPPSGPGGRGRKAQPFLADALEQSRDNIQSILQNAGEQYMEKVANG